MGIRTGTRNDELSNTAQPSSGQCRVGRRDFLRTSALAGAGALAGGTVLGRSATALAGRRKEYKTKHVILVAFAGGVRARDCIGSPENITKMSAIAAKGVVLPSVKAANLGHYGAALALMTGCPEARGIRENGRGEVPTIFEYLRKDGGLSASDVWLSTTAGAQTRNFAYSTNKNYGAEYGANLISTDGLFNAEFRDLIGKFGNASLPGKKETKQVKKLVGALDNRLINGAVGGGIGNDAETSLRIQRYILEELRGDTARITGPGSGDAKSIRVARNLLRLFRPKLITIVLQNADVAHGSYNSYVEVIRRNDQEIGMLWDSVQKDPELRDTTSIMILPEFGRNANLNERNGLDHGDGSEDLRKLFMIAAGPDFKQGATMTKAVNSYDVCPTIAELLGTKAEDARGKVLRSILA